MKNIVKGIWSEWNKTDKIIATLSIIAIVLLLCTTKCSAQSPTSNIPEMEYGDVETDIFYESIYSENIIDFIYDAQENKYYIEYYEHGFVFNESEEEYLENGEKIITIECSNSVFLNFLKWYSENIDWDGVCPDYMIKTVITPVDGGDNYRFYLEKR